ncbi:MAG TPA: hypothetical protein PKY95_12505, partial [candidate division Zixibacteria bacterium]|nr:hypothetical protein [candidate division Zixibacteria bacterium]
EEEVVSVPTDGGYMPATRSTTETAFALHLGVQLNPPAARSPIRPRVALGAGLWMFNSDIAYRVDREDDPFLSDDETSFEFGLRGNGGIDVFFAEKWGIALDFTFDRLFGVDRVVPTDDAGGGRPAAQTARYFSAALGLVAPLDRLF